MLSGKAKFLKSENDYDWLGPGVYFWEANPQRALEFATEKRGRAEGIQKPFVVGGVIDLGLCLEDVYKRQLLHVPESGLRVE